MGKINTPAWIVEGYDSPAEYNKVKGIKTEKKIERKTEAKDKNNKNIKLAKSDGKTFKIKRCPKCSSDDVGVVLTGEEGRKAKEWECKKCKWKGENVKEEELDEEEFMKYLDERGEEVA